MRLALSLAVVFSLSNIALAQNCEDVLRYLVSKSEVIDYRLTRG